MNIVAMADATTVTMLPVAAVTGGGAIPASPAREPFSFTLDKGQHAQLAQTADLTGSVLLADKPIGFLAGQRCMRMPSGTSHCDHAEQMIPPLRALGSKYVGVMYRPRIPAETSSYWRLIGTQPDTQLTWSSDVGGPSTLQQGESVVFQTGTPFVVQSQDAEHPFMLFEYMTGSQALIGLNGYGDPDFVISVPPQQYLSSYVFFTDPTYPETNLVMVRTRGKDAQFHDVTLDCLGVVPDWTRVGDDYEWARVDLSRNDFESVGECGNGAHQISSDAPFGLWIWGWGRPNTTIFTQNTSYGYPAGMNLQTLNQVVILPEP